MMADKTLQHSLPGVDPPKPPPDWLRPLIEAIAAIGQPLTIVIWTVIGLGVLLIVFLIVRELFGVRLGWKGGKDFKKLGATDWRPDREKARILLLDADALAAEGRFDEAVHMLLLRGVADIIARRPRLIGPALTSRDIAALPDLPEQARPAFALIAEIVERSFFGGRPVDEAGWLRAREAYEQLVLSGTWS
ncbi:hypothetical protein AMEJIAPC_02378 [Caulobacter sp. NIBR1757]|nr:hypothetical protein AMEJIAPC_02378 [Caulobacter sp. NIBR1757]